MGLNDLALHAVAAVAIGKSNTLLVQSPYSGYGETALAVTDINTGIATLVTSSQGYISTNFFSAVRLPLISQCAVAGLPITDVAGAMSNYITAAELCGSGNLFNHIIGHLDDLLGNSYNNSNAINAYNHIITDLSTQNTYVTLMNTAMGLFFDLQDRITNAYGFLLEILGCVSGVYNSFNTSSMRNIYTALGLGTSDSSKKSSDMTRSMISADAHKDESDYNTRISNMRDDMINNSIIESSTTVSASAVDNSFNTTNDDFTVSINDGDKIKTSGFLTGSLNGIFTVASRPKASKMTVAESLIDESAGAAVTFKLNVAKNCDTISVIASDNSFNYTSGGFANYSRIKSGDRIETSGFSNGENNGVYTVIGTPTSTKIKAIGNLVDESASNNVTIDWRMVNLSTSVSASSASKTFTNDDAIGFSPYLIIGDEITTSGFLNSGNNGTFTVNAELAGRKLLVDEILTNESAGQSVTIKSGFDVDMQVEKLKTDGYVSNIDINTVWTPS
jgi:hypothetical protein